FGHPLSLLSPQFMPDEVPWLYSLEAAGFSASAEYLALVKLLDFERLRKLAHEYLVKAGCKADELEMEREGEEFRVAWRGKPAVKMGDREFLRFLFGPHPPEDKELQALFPVRLWYWGMDSV